MDNCSEQFSLPSPKTSPFSFTLLGGLPPRPPEPRFSKGSLHARVKGLLSSG